jgi:hypothetical protein
VKNVGKFILTIAVIFGIKFYNKASAQTEGKDHLFALCEKDQYCLDVVEGSYDYCFEKNYSLGGRRNGGSLDQNKFLQCLNNEAETQIFTIIK